MTMIGDMPDARLRVLVVDDEMPNLTTFRRVFRKDFDLLTAQSATEAIELLAKEAVDVVLTDYSMPQMNGFDFLRVVQERWPKVGRMMITAYSDHDMVKNARAEGLLRGVVGKPWDRNEIVRAIAGVAQAMRGPEHREG